MHYRMANFHDRKIQRRFLFYFYPLLNVHFIFFTNVTIYDHLVISFLVLFSIFIKILLILILLLDLNISSIIRNCYLIVLLELIIF